MAARDSVNPLATDSPTVTARNSSASSPSPHLARNDEDLAPLGVPALVVGVMLICAGLAALLPLRSWARDYGLVLVIPAYILHMSLAGALGMWGMRTIRKLHATKQRPDESKNL
jgi:protein-S-isoprenylcysteine O-methyltransferase Ste14